MEKFYDKVCESYNVWHSKIKPNVDNLSSYLFEEGIYRIKIHYQNKEYKEALAIVSTLKNAFNPKNYENEKWKDSANEILENLTGLEKLAQDYKK